ncbi:HEAT repeat domain-containing protein [Patescibacteria group bacterium]
MKKIKSRINSAKFGILTALIFGLGFLTGTFLITSVWIGNDVKIQCKSSEVEYGGDCVERLMVLVSDEERSFRDRNTAIWALGQLGDEKAKPTLESLYTGEIPEREPQDEMISQHELKKALNLVSGGLNITRFIWGPSSESFTD